MLRPRGPLRVRLGHALIEQIFSDSAGSGHGDRRARGLGQAGSDRLTLMSRLAAQSREGAALTVLPFRSPHLRREDGVASRIDWHPTSVHLRFLELLRGEVRRVAGGGRSGAQAA
jgi:hypothetical protein